MDQPEEKEIEPGGEIGSPCSSDKENSSSVESQRFSKDPPKSQNIDLNDYETMEELDFEDERRDTDQQKYVNILQISVQQNVISDFQNEASPKKNPGINVENNNLPTEPKSMNLETQKQNCDTSDIEEGETVDDDGECVDIEDGEIDDVSKAEDLQKYSCRFYQRGRCSFGKECRYLHLSDKGLYNMFDSPVKRKKPLLLQNISFVTEPTYVCQVRPPPIELEKSSESIWDKALYEAKQRIKQSKMHKDDDCFEEKIHLKIEADDRLLTKSRTSGYPRDRPISPVLVPERIVCASSNRYDSKKSERVKHVSGAAKSNVAKSTVGRKFGYDSEWRDPWRRSKTPPKRKRLPSKSFSDSSKSSISSDKSNFSWESANRSCRSPSPKRSKSYRSSSRRSRSHSYGHKESPLRSFRRKSSGSYRGSTSSRSRSSSPDFNSSKIYSHGSRKTLKSPSSSPVCQKPKKDRCSVDSIDLPYKRRSRSKSQPTVQRRVFRKVQSTEKKNANVLSKQSITYRSKSKSPNCSKPHKRGQSEASSSSCSGSDMSISSISDSSLSRKSNYSGKDSDYKFGTRIREVPKMKTDKLISKVSSSRSHIVDNLPRSFRMPNKDKSVRSTFTPVLDAKMQTKAKNTKQIKALEMELLKYQTDLRKLPPRPTVKTQPKTTQLSQNIAAATNSKNTEIEVNPEINSLSTLNKSVVEVSDKKPTKRDLLMLQLKAVEEAIARKKKTVCST